MSPVSKFSSYGEFETMAMGNIKTEAPTIGTATDVGTGRAYNNGAATVTFTAPASNGSSLPITSYTVTSSPGGFTATGASSPLTVTGLQSSTSYTFTVIATNAAGNSPASAASNSITATTVPQAPTIGTATAVTFSTATVAYTAGATGGKAVSVYTATSSPGSLTGTGTSPITVSGLTGSTAYTFTVTATNANGTSAASTASNSITTPVPQRVVSYVIVASGGSYSNTPNPVNRAAGGAGGVLQGTTNCVLGTTYTVTIGAGVTVTAPTYTNLQGQPSTFNGISATGGGFGSVGSNNGGSGGSGGGAGVFPGLGGSGTPGQGFAGGSAGSAGGSGGGGGAGAVGTNGGYSAPYALAGAGGIGIIETLTGTSLKLAGGGTSPGFAYTGTLYPDYGGGNSTYPGSGTPSQSAVANTGGGASNAASITSGSGVIILSANTPAASTTGSPQVYTNGGNTVYRFTGSGSITY
jgi:hypothetical protein